MVIAFRLNNGHARSRDCLFQKVTALFCILIFISFDVMCYVSPSYASEPAVLRSKAVPFAVPKNLGTLEESFHGSSGKTIFFIQDAHDSLEAQENIAKMIGKFVKENGVKTVFEEGYEGVVPSDKFFGFIKNPKIKQKVSYFLLDKLRVGGAEYAHINRTNDFKLTGVENIKLYGKNIQYYKEASKRREEVSEDLKELFTQILNLASQYFPENLKALLKVSERFADEKLPLLNYLKELQRFYQRGPSSHFGEQFLKKYPAIAILLSAETVADPVLIKQLNEMDFKEVFGEIFQLEQDISNAYLSAERDRKIFTYYQMIQLLMKLNQIKLTQPEYEAAKKTLENFKTQQLADFVVSLTHRSLVLSKEWERNIKKSILFYDVAQERDKTIKGYIGDFFRSEKESTAILVFGGFHAGGIKEILREHQISYYVISPGITSADKRHQDYYKRLMSGGHYSFETPFLAARSNRPPSIFFLAAMLGDEISIRAELSSIAVSVRQRRDHVSPLSEENFMRPKARSEVRRYVLDDEEVKVLDSLKGGWKSGRLQDDYPYREWDLWFKAETNLEKEKVRSLNKFVVQAMPALLAKEPSLATAERLNRFLEMDSSAGGERLTGKFLNSITAFIEANRVLATPEALAFVLKFVSEKDDWVPYEGYFDNVIIYTNKVLRALAKNPRVFTSANLSLAEVLMHGNYSAQIKGIGLVAFALSLQNAPLNQVPSKYTSRKNFNFILQLLKELTDSYGIENEFGSYDEYIYPLLEGFWSRNESLIDADLISSLARIYDHPSHRGKATDAYSKAQLVAKVLSRFPQLAIDRDMWFEIFIGDDFAKPGTLRAREVFEAIRMIVFHRPDIRPWVTEELKKQLPHLREGEEERQMYQDILESWPFKNGFDSDTEALVDTIYAKLDLNNLTVGSQQLVKTYVLQMVLRTKSDFFSKLKTEDTEKELRETVVPSLRIIEELYRETPPVGVEVALPVSLLSASEISTIRQQANYLFSIPRYTASPGTQVRGDHLELRIHPSYYPILSANVALLLSLGVIPNKGVTMRAESQRKDLPYQFFPYYHTSVQGRVKGGAVPIIAIGFNTDSSFIHLDQLEQGKDHSFMLADKYETVFFPGGYEGQAYDVRTGEYISDRQSNFFDHITLGIKNPKDQIVFFYARDFKLKALLAKLFNVLSLTKSDEDFSRGLFKIASEFRKQFKSLLKFMNLMDEEASLILGEGYDYSDNVRTPYLYDRHRIISAIQLLRKAIDGTERGVAILKEFLEATVTQIEATFLTTPLKRELAKIAENDLSRGKLSSVVERVARGVYIDGEEDEALLLLKMSRSPLYEKINSALKRQKGEFRSETRDNDADAEEQLPHGMEIFWKMLGLSEEEALKLKPIAQTVLAAGITALGMTGASHGSEIDLIILNYKLRLLAQNPNSGITADMIRKILEDVRSGRIVLSGEDLNVIEQGADGQVRSVGPLDARIVHPYRILHQSANVFVLTPRGTLLLQRRVHNKVKPFALTIFGGQVSYGASIKQTAFNELAEEAGLGKGWPFKGIWRQIDGENGFVSERVDPPNRERITNSIYFASKEETEKILKYGQMLEAKKSSMTHPQFERWLEKEQRRKNGLGETWAIYEVDLKDVLQMLAAEKGVKKNQSVSARVKKTALGLLTKTDIFSGGEVHFEPELTDDLLKPLLEDPAVVATLKRAVEAAKVNQATIVSRIADIRGLFAEQKYKEAQLPIQEVLKDIRAVLSAGTEPGDNLIPLLYLAQVMENFAKPNVPRRVTAAQILLIDSTGEKVLLQKRGPYKRLFSGKFTVSANAKLDKENQNEISVKATQGKTELDKENQNKICAKAIQGETGLEKIDVKRLTEISSAKERVSQLVSYDFYAVTPEEREKLRAYFQAHKKDDVFKNGIRLDWNDEKRSLFLYSLAGEQDMNVIRNMAELIQGETGVPPIYPVFDENHGKLLVYRLTKEEEDFLIKKINTAKQTRLNAVADLSEQGSPNVFRAIDSDEMLFRSWREIESQFKSDPHAFALDLAGPYFGDPLVWKEIFPDFLNVDDLAAASVAVSGGKGANTHVLRALMKTETVVGLSVPDAGVITTHAFERVVQGDPIIRPLLADLEKTNGESEIKIISEKIRNRILELNIPKDLEEKITAEFYQLGGKVAVRSSATVEDLKNFSGAGMAKTLLYQISPEQTLKAVKEVWASLFDDGFVAQRRKAGLSASDAKMGVMLQEFIDPKASGVSFSIDEHDRTVIKIDAALGVGESVVDGDHPVDSWLVGSLADSILERRIKLKTHMKITNQKGGIENVPINPEAGELPSLSDGELLELARLVKLIQRYYRANGLAEHVDVEFAFDKKGQVFIVQTRSKNFQHVHAKDEAVFVVRTVDESKTKDVPSISLNPGAFVAYRGAQTAKLQLLSGQTAGNEEDDKHLVALVKPGVILVAHHTNNEFNDVFAKLKGVITTDGGATSHAAQNSSPLKVPCVVGAADAFEKLAAWDGKLVTFDSERRKIYLGAVPIIEERRLVGMWDTEEGSSEEAALKHVETHEIFDRWTPLQEKRPEVYERFPEDGNLRRRSHGYRWFQLDYYWRAWERLTEIFEKMFEDRGPFPLKTQERVIKVDKQKDARQPDEPPDVVRLALHHRVSRDDPGSIFHFVKSAKDLVVEDLQEIFDARWGGFSQFADAMSKIQDINADNVETLVDALIDVFAWMHIGFWLDVLVNHIFAFDHIRYLNANFRSVVMNEATRDLPADVSVDKERKDVPFGKILKMSRQKDKEIYSLIEQIWSDRVLSELFKSHSDPKQLAEALNQKPSYRWVFEKIDSWSSRFKHDSEHLDQLSDTLDYIKDVRERVSKGNSLTFDHIVEEGVFPHIKKFGKKQASIKFLKEKDEALYLLIRSFVRVNRVKANKPWLVDKKDLSDAVLQKGIIREINKRIAEIEEPKRKTAEEALKNYEWLSNIIALRHQEFLLREDGHHLITPHQRKIARMMLEVGQRYAHILGNPQIIFDISTDELIALLKDPNPEYVMKTIPRTCLYKNFETELSAAWPQSPEQAVEQYASNLEQIFSILEEQASLASLERVKKSYQHEEARLRARIAWLRDSVKLLKLKELLNERDVSRQALRAHVLLICGNDFLDNFQEAVDLYAAGKINKLLISGGLGRGTLSLIRSALSEGIPIHISENEVIMHENQLARLVALNEKGQLKNALKRTEADIIREIILYMASKKKDKKGNPRPVAIKEDDIILESETSIITEYFEKTKPIFTSLHEELGLGEDDPLVVAYMHDPIIQFRTKGTFLVSYADELKKGTITGISYAIDHDIYAQDRNTVKLSMLREMFALILFSEAGDIRPTYKGQAGLSAIPKAYWEAAAEIVKSFPDAEGLKKFIFGMYDGLKKRKATLLDFSNLLAGAPENAQPFSRALEELFRKNQIERRSEARVDKRGDEQAPSSVGSFANKSILIYSPNHFSTNGVRTYLEDLMPALAEKNTNLAIHVVALKGSFSQKSTADKIFSNKSKIVYHEVDTSENSAAAADKIQDELAKADYKTMDLIISHAPFQKAGEQFNVWGKEKGIPVIQTYHGGPWGILDQTLTAQILNGADVASVPSRYIADKLNQDYSVKNISVLNPVADLDFWNPSLVTTKTIQGLRKQYGIENDFVVFMAGHFSLEKGFEIAVRAAKQMRRDRNHRVAVVIAGPMTAQNKAYREGLIREAGDDVRLVFLGDLEKNAMRNWYALSDVAVMPSLKPTDSIAGEETFGLISIEAQSMGKPVIVSNVGGLPETLDGAGLRTPTTGFIFKQGDIHALAEHLQLLYDQPGLGKELGRRAFTNIHKRFGKDELIKKHSMFYAEVIARALRRSELRSQLRERPEQKPLTMRVPSILKTSAVLAPWKWVRKMRQNSRPVVAFVDAEDFPNLSLAQKQEYFLMALWNKAIRIIVYNEHGQTQDGQFEAFLRLDRVERTNKNLNQAVMTFSRVNVPAIHLSKHILPSQTLVGSLRKKIAFFKTNGDKSGTLTTALLWAISGGEEVHFVGVKENEGFWTVEETLLDALQKIYENDFAFALAA